MKLLLPVAIALFTFACSHQPPAAAPQPAPVTVQVQSNPRMPANDADTKDLKKMTDDELLGYTGKVILAYVLECPAPAYILLATATLETFPTTLMTGGASAVNLGKFGYNLLFNSSDASTANIFGQVRASYPATTRLAEKFTTVGGVCGNTGRRLIEVLKEIQLRQTVYAVQKQKN